MDLAKLSNDLKTVASSPQCPPEVAASCRNAANKLSRPEFTSGAAAGGLPAWLVTLLTVLAQILPQILPFLEPTPPDPLPRTGE